MSPSASFPPMTISPRCFLEHGTRSAVIYLSSEPPLWLVRERAWQETVRAREVMREMKFAGCAWDRFASWSCKFILCLHVCACRGFWLCFCTSATGPLNITPHWIYIHGIVRIRVQVSSLTNDLWLFGVMSLDCWLWWHIWLDEVRQQTTLDLAKVFSLLCPLPGLIEDASQGHPVESRRKGNHNGLRWSSCAQEATMRGWGYYNSIIGYPLKNVCTAGSPLLCVAGLT